MQAAKQGLAKDFLQLPDLVADGRRSEAELGGGGCEAAQTGSGFEGSQQDKTGDLAHFQMFVVRCFFR